MKERQYLRPNSTILLCGKNNDRKPFTILKRLGDKTEGASSICYEAYHKNSGLGVLKEFYPQDAYGLDRDRSGQLLHSGEFEDARQRFLKAKAEYLEPYEALLQAKKSTKNRELSSFIPAFEIYHGCDASGEITGTAYIWMPNPKLKTFERICDEIHRHPNRSPEHKLVLVLSAMETLTSCVCELHCMDMVHRDINPNNFGFVVRRNETLTQTLTMFDMDSICSVFSKSSMVVGSEGYMEPEAVNQAPNNQSDIYSIGATLFHAIIVSDEAEANQYRYRPDDYDRLHEMVRSSRLIQASEANSHPRLRSVLTKILQKCLCPRAGRYPNCEALLQDLKTALYYALPSEISKSRSSGERWILADIEKSLDVNREKNTFLAIQYHLYEHPLYECCPPESELIRVLQIGFGNYGQKFLDACLQNGQMRNRRLNVTVVSDDPGDKEIYLADRPELTGFFNVDGSLKDAEDAYGSITFDLVHLKAEARAANAQVLQQLLRDCPGGCPHYIFIALGDPALNRAAARACRQAIDAAKGSCVITYVCETRQSASGAGSRLIPLYVNEEIKASPLFPEIERMAFNTHLAWEKDLNVDFRQTRADFRKKYNHDACVSNVLSLKYKLYSIGIRLEETGFQTAAALFERILSRPEGRRIRNELIWIEHRRWVTEKLCLGWRGIRDLEDCAGGLTKDEKRKRHVCILKSRPNQKLAEEFDRSAWDLDSGLDLDELDELDRMSVELHRMYERNALDAKRKNLLSGSLMESIRALAEDGEKTQVAFREWLTCLKAIWSGNQKKVTLYRGLTEALLRASGELKAENRTALHEQIKALEAVFYPILASAEYRDWKQLDTRLIDSIPFVLTYTTDTLLAIPFLAGDRAAAFGNVAAVAVINPARILYLYRIESLQDALALESAVPDTIAFLKKKNIRAAVDFVLLYSASASELADRHPEKTLPLCGDGRIRNVKPIRLGDGENQTGELLEYLLRRSRRPAFFALEKNGAALSALLEENGFYQTFPSYRFDSKHMRFCSEAGCEMLSRIRKTPFLSVGDFAAVQRSAGNSADQPEFFHDYEALWRRYSENKRLWKALCSSLGRHAQTHDVLAVFPGKEAQSQTAKAERCTYILPFCCLQSVDRILQSLIRRGVLDEESRVSGYTATACEVVIADRSGSRAEFDKLFSNIYALNMPDAFSLCGASPDGKVRVLLDQLMVTGARIDGAPAAEVSELMRFFAEMGYLIHPKIDQDGCWSFTYATAQIKQLLTRPEKLLEVYLYHNVRECGAFDDAASGFELEYGSPDAGRIPCCILTKGFRTMIAACASNPADPDAVCSRLAQWAKESGINAAAVLVDDSPAARTRGTRSGVITICDPDQIEAIGSTLLEVIDGSDHPPQEPEPPAASPYVRR